MTAAEFAIYILRGNIGDKVIIDPVTGKFNFESLELLSLESAAEIFGVGTATIKAWCDLQELDFLKKDDVFYIFYNEKFRIKQEGMWFS